MHLISKKGQIIALNKATEFKNYSSTIFSL